MRFVEYQHDARRLNDLPRERVHVELLIPKRQAPHVGVVLAVVRHPLLQQLAGPRPQWEAVLEPGADIAEGGQRPFVEAERFSRLVRAAGHVAVNAREVRLAVCRAGRRPVQINFSVGSSRRTGILVVWPLGARRGSKDRERANESKEPDEHVHSASGNRD